jgi:hypothetical protein
MAEIGDRVIVESEKVGQAQRRGTVIGLSGHMLRLRWEDGTESLLTPGAGALRVVGHEDLTAKDRREGKR